MSNKLNRQVPFGLHLMLDMYNCIPQVLDDKKLILDILQELPKELGMKILLDPVAAFIEPNEERDQGGWSGFAMIQESHISIHTFIKRRFVIIDVYSSKEFDTKYIIDYFKKVFKTVVVDFEFEQRGIL